MIFGIADYFSLTAKKSKILLFVFFRIDKIKIFNTSQTLEEWMTQNSNFITTNGLLNPVMTLRTGQTKRFR